MTGRSAKLLLPVAALCALALGAAAPAEARVAPGFVGLVDDTLIDASPAKRRAELRTQRSAGAGTLRQIFDWARMERQPGRYDFSEYDELVADAARRGLRMLPMLYNPPSFRSSRPSRGARLGVYPPKRNADMGHWAALLVRRYGPEGTLWRERPELPRLPIGSWQLWNEASIKIYWPRGPSPRRYVRLLSVVGKAIKAEDRRAEIVTGGLAQSRLGIPFERFVAGMYRAGGRSAFDTLAVHLYARSHRGVIAAARGVRRLMNRYGDRRGRMWVTEVGWSTSGPRSVFRTSGHGQARRIRGALLGLAKRRGRLRLRGVVYYKWRDSRRTRRMPDFFGLHTGLLNARGRRKPGFHAFRRAARSLTR